MGLLEAARRRDAATGRRVECRYGARPRPSATRVAEAGRRLGVAEHHGRARRLVGAEQLAHPLAELDARRRSTTGGRCGTCLPSTSTPAGAPAWGCAAGPGRAARAARRRRRADAEPLGDPRARTTPRCARVVVPCRQVPSAALIRVPQSGREQVHEADVLVGDAEDLGAQQGALGPGAVRLHLVHLVRVRGAQHAAAAALGPQDVLGVAELLVADHGQRVHGQRRGWGGCRSCPAARWPGRARSRGAARPCRARSARCAAPRPVLE